MRTFISCFLPEYFWLLAQTKAMDDVVVLFIVSLSPWRSERNGKGATVWCRTFQSWLFFYSGSFKPSSARLRWCARKRAEDDLILVVPEWKLFTFCISKLNCLSWLRALWLLAAGMEKDPASLSVLRLQACKPSGSHSLGFVDISDYKISPRVLNGYTTATSRQLATSQRFLY